MPYRGCWPRGHRDPLLFAARASVPTSGEVRDVVESDLLNMEKYLKEIASLLADADQATGKIFEEEHMRMINMVTSVHPGGVGGGNRVPKGIMEHKVII